MNKSANRIALRVFCVAVFCTALLPLNVFAQAGFSKAFSPSTIGSGANSTLIFTINNIEGAGATDLAFTDNLPAGVTISTPAVVINECGGTVTAPAGGTTITLADGLIGAGAICTIQVNVAGSTAGTHVNLTGDLTSSAGNSGTATANLVVDAGRPGFSKSFSPATISLGGRSTLTFTIDNSAVQSASNSITFSDTLPVGLVIANPANASTSCTGGVLTAVPGSNTFSYSPAFFGDGSVAAGATCTVSVDVEGSATGVHNNVSGVMTSNVGFQFGLPSGFATDTLTVTTGPLPFTKAFNGDPINPGGTVTLEFSITNADRDFAATNIAFTDDLDATLSGLVATGLPATDVCGTGSTLSGTNLITLSGGNLGAGGSCTFSVTLQVPAAATAGAYPNTTSPITADVNGSPVTGGPANETLFVNDAPVLSKTFLTNPVGAGDTVSVEFTVTNTSTSSAATDIAFTDNITSFNSGSTISALPAAGFCGAGSMLFTSIAGGELVLNMISGNLPASGSCTFTVDLTIPTGTPAGDYTNTTSEVSATVDGVTQIGNAAEAILTVVAGPILTKSFTDDPVLPGSTVTLEFTLTHDAVAPADATGINFTDDLGAVVAGLAATGLPQNDVCGVGSLISGTTNLSFTGGTLAPGASCTFSVTVQVPAAAVGGVYPNTTSAVLATVSGVAVTENPAIDDLQIAGLTLTKEFIDDPVLPGGTVTLEFTLDNSMATQDATGIFFTDALNANLPGLAAITLPANDFCGAGSSITGTTFLIMVGGNLLAGESCTFSVTAQVPAGAADGDYGNTTSSVTATIGGGVLVLPPANDTLSVSSTLLDLSKSFTDGPAAPGGTVTLEFTINNLDALNPITDIGFTDDLDAALSGLVALGLPQSDVCGVGSVFSGSSLLTLTGGNLPAGGSCTFSVSLQLPAVINSGSTVTNTTSSVSGSLGGLAVSGSPANAELLVETLSLSKLFDGPSVAGGTPVLILTLQNLSTTDTATGISLNDDLDATLSGLVATGLPQSDICGTGSQLSGTSVVNLVGGELLPSGSCTINIPLQVPPTAVAGTYPNTTSPLFVSGVQASDPASADLVIEPPPTFAKVFAPDLIAIDGISTLTFTIDNSASALSAGSLTFADNLPAGIVVATPDNAAHTCTGGTLTAVSGAATISYSGGTVAAGAACTLSVDVTGSVPGPYLNVSIDLTSTSGNSGGATDTLVIDSAPVVTAPTDIVMEATGPLTPVSLGTGTAVDALDGPLTPTPDNTGPFPLGDTTVTWTAVDSLGNVGTDTQLVTIVDTTPPAVTPPADITLEATGPLTAVSLGTATANDLVDGALTPTPDNTGPFPVGMTTVIWSVTDAAGNTGTATQIVTITDTTPPTVTVLGDNPLNLETGDTFVDDGATAVDLVDGDLTGVIMISGSVDTSTPGVYPVTYEATDAAGNTGTATRSVIVTDATAPTVTAPADIVMEATGPLTPVSLGTATVTDDVDVGLVATPDDSGPFPLGDTIVTWSATDAAGNTGFDVQTVTIVDTTPPDVTVLGADPLMLNTGDTFTDPGATALDLVDGDLTAMISVSGTVNTAVPGTYILTYSVTDSSGNTGTATRDVVVVDGTAPTVTAPADITMEATGPLTPVALGVATVIDDVDVGLMATADNTGPFPLGDTIVTWSATDTAGNTGMDTQTVTIVDTTPPVVTPLGDNPLNLQVDEVFTDPGATAIDLVGGDLSGSINVTGSVNTALPGTYVLTYSATDLSGNTGTATRTVNVGSVRSFSGLLPSGNPGMISFTSPDVGCTFIVDPMFLPASSAVPPPPTDIRLIDGVVSFVIERCQPGATVDITLDYGQPLPTSALFWKAGSPWFSLPSTVSGSQITFSITDGGTGDEDGSANGTITDPGGAAILANFSDNRAMPIPTLSPWALLLLMLAMAGLVGRYRFS